jgi:ribonuclease HI
MNVKTYVKSLSLDELRVLEELVVAEIRSKSSKQKKNKKILVYTDGASRGNPGHAGIGFLLFDDNNEKLVQDFHYIGITTNNEAEYRALLAALDRAAEVTQDTVECYADSELMVRQLNGQYQIKSEKLIKFYEEVMARKKMFASVTFNHVPREHPRLRLADKLANRGIDEAKPL